jgi:hypothetical protein
VARKQPQKDSQYVTRLSPAIQLAIRISSGLLVATVIAIALTVPAPGFGERPHIPDDPLSHFGR